MRKLHPAALALIVISASACVAWAEDHANLGSISAGLRFVGYNCDACHVTAKNQELRPLVSGYAPSFSEIANRPGTTRDTLQAFLSRPHGYSNMPYPDLTPSDLRATVA